MPAKTKRVMMKHGTSAVVSIPMDYRRYHNLNPGDEMIILYGSLIIMVPKTMESLIEKKKALIDELLGE